MAKSEPLNDEELAFSMQCFMEDYGGERMIRATSKACKMIAEQADKDLDGTSRDIYMKASHMIHDAAEYLAEN